MTKDDALKGPSLQLPILQRKPETSPATVSETNNMVDVGPLLHAFEQSFEATITKFHQGPLPDPDTFAAYNRALPDAAERIMNMAENSLASQITLAQRSQEHKHRIEHRQLRLAERSQWCALAVVGIVVGAGVWLVSQGHSWVGGLAMGLPLLGLVGAFLYPQLRKPASGNAPATSSEPSPTPPEQRSRRRGHRSSTESDTA